MPLTRPIIVAVRLNADDAAPVLLRLDSGSNAPLLYAVPPRFLGTSASRAQLLRRKVNGMEQAFVGPPAQDILVGECPVRQVSLVVPTSGKDSNSEKRQTTVFKFPSRRRRDHPGYRCVSISTRVQLRVQFAQLLANRAGSEIDMSVLNQKSDDFDTLQIPCSDPGFFRETQ